MHMKKLLNPVIFIIGIASGIIVNEFYANWPLITLNKSISLTHVILILINVSLAFIFSYYLTRKWNTSNKVNDVLINKILLSLQDLEVLISDVENGKLTLVKINSRLKRTSIAITQLVLEIKTRKTSKKESIEELNTQIKAIKKSMTYTDIVSEATVGEKEIEITDGKVKYSENRIAQITTEIEIFKTNLFKIQLLIVETNN
jgi:hypothetical protein